MIGAGYSHSLWREEEWSVTETTPLGIETKHSKGSEMNQKYGRRM